MLGQIRTNVASRDRSEQAYLFHIEVITFTCLF